MRPCLQPALSVRQASFGGPAPLICVPLVAGSLPELLDQAQYAHAQGPDVVEWRADFYDDLSADAVSAALTQLREALPRELLLFTVRASTEGGARPIAPHTRSQVILGAIGSGRIDLVDLELATGPEAIQTVRSAARARGVRLVLSCHDFQQTPPNGALLSAISQMVRDGADIAKVACMPQDPSDVLRLLDVTLTARRMFPTTGLVTMAMGPLGVVSRATGFLYGSDMSFAAGKASSAPGQIPIAELRTLFEAFGRHA